MLDVDVVDAGRRQELLELRRGEVRVRHRDDGDPSGSGGSHELEDRVVGEHEVRLDGELRLDELVPRRDQHGIGELVVDLGERHLGERAGVALPRPCALLGLLACCGEQRRRHERRDPRIVDQSDPEELERVDGSRDPTEQEGVEHVHRQRVDAALVDGRERWCESRVEHPILRRGCHLSSSRVPSGTGLDQRPRSRTSPRSSAPPSWRTRSS